MADEQFGDSAGSRVALEFADRLNSYANGIGAASAILAYLQVNAGDSLKLLRDLELYAVANYLVLDDATRANLELVASYQGDRKGSLLAILDRTITDHRCTPAAPLAALSIA
jgi:DNA mismatch repair ATPase MutS